MHSVFRGTAPALFLLLVLGGCDQKKPDAGFVSDSLTEVVTPHVPPATPASSPGTAQPAIRPANAPKPPIGIEVSQGRIVIDTNQTRRFLESLTRKLDKNFQKIETDLRNGRINSPNDIGVVITPDRIEVDINQTEKFMKKWIKSMQSVGRQLDNVFQELDRSLKP